MMMKRIDFIDGVKNLTAFLLLPIILHINGCLDQHTYVSDIHENSFYENSTEAIHVYSHYKYFLFAIYVILFNTCFSFILSSFVKRIARYQIHCYRLYFPYHCTVCVLPLVLRYTNITATASDDIMAAMDWERLFSIIFSISRFILSVFLFIVQRYRFWRLVSYVLITAIHSLVITYLFYILCTNCEEQLNVIKKTKEEFLTEWSYVDVEQLNDLNVSKLNTYSKTFGLDQNLFLKTGQKFYQTQYVLNSRFEDIDGTIRPYQQGIYLVGIGESINLPCKAIVHNEASVTVLWTLSYPHLNFRFSEENSTSSNIITTELNIDYVENTDFGDITCSFLFYQQFGSKLFFQHKMASPFIRWSEFLIAQYSVRKYSGRDFYIYATPGGAIHIKWKRMSFNNEVEDIIQYYYVNGVPFHRPESSKLFCSSLSYLYILYGRAMNWFFVPYLSESPHFLLNQSVFETHFTDCVGSHVFGIHTVEYFRRVFDKKSGSFVLQEVQHPDTIYVLPDTPYFYKMDNASKAKKKEIIQNLQKMDLDYTWFDNSDTCILIVRVVLELIIVLILILLCAFSLHKCSNWYECNVLQPIRKTILGQPSDEIAGQCPAVRCSSSYCCYVLCGHSDRNSVYSHLVVPLRKENILTGFIFEECFINKSGKSIFDIQCDLLEKSEHLIFYLTSAYLEEEKFADIQLETVLRCIKMGFISTNRVLIIIADNCELPEKFRYNLPEAAANIHDWVTIKNPDKRIRLVLKWINSLKNPRNSDVVVSTVFLG